MNSKNLAQQVQELKEELEIMNQDMNDHNLQTSTLQPSNGLIETSPSMAEAPRNMSEGKTLEVNAMRSRLQELGQAINSLRSKREQLNQELEATNDNLLRSEGAYVMLESVIKEMSPQSSQVAQGMGG